MLTNHFIGHLKKLSKPKKPCYDFSSRSCFLVRMIKKGQLWKSVIKDFFPEVISFLYPKQANQLDFREIRYLDEILAGLIPREGTTENEVFRLAQIPTQDGNPIWFLVCVVTEKPPQNDLEGRLFKQFYKILDQYNIAVEIMVLFVDSDPDFHPRRFHSKSLINQTSLDYETYKLTNQSVRLLSSNENPISMFLLISLQAIQQPEVEDNELLPLKLKLFRKFLSNGYDIHTIAKLIVFLQHYLPFRDMSTNSIFEETINALLDNLRVELPKLIREEEQRINILSQ